MKANSKEGQTRFYLQKTVVNNYALSILVIRQQTHLLKITILIVPRSLTMIDPQPSKAHFNTTQPIPIPGFTNHVRVHAAHDREHGCHNSFTLCRGCTCSPWVVIILGKSNTCCTDKHSYTLPRCVPGNHYKAIQWFHLACNVPTEVSPPVWASHPPRSPLLCLMGYSRLSCTHTIPWFIHRSFTK
jgi:hypothetical protein